MKLKKFTLLSAWILCFCLLGSFPGAAADAASLSCRLNPRGDVLSGTLQIQQKLLGRNLACKVTLHPAEPSAAEAVAESILLGEYPLAISLPGAFHFDAPLADLPERTRFFCRATIVNKSGKELLQAETRIATPPDPAHWSNFTEGIPDGTVPAPWTPVEMDSNRIKVWGREFVFNNSPLPEQFLSQGQELLAEPSQLILSPRPKEWKLVKTEQPNDTVVSLYWEGILPGNAACQARTEVYFDGIVRLDMTFSEGLTIKEYRLHFPVKRSVAQTLHRGPWAFGGIKTTYPLTRAEDHPIRPQLFLFNDDVGFGWFDGMSFNWPLANPSKALEIKPSNQKVDFTVNYIDEAVTLDQARTYTAGLQMLPVRPMPEKADEMRMCYTVRYGDEVTPAWFGTVDYDTKGNILQECGTAELQVKLDFDPATHQEEEVFWETSHGSLRFKFGWIPNGGIFAQIYEDCINKVYLTTGLHPKEGEWNHFAISWGKEVVIYFNGERIASAAHAGSNRAMPVLIHAGGKHVSVDGLKISNIERSDFMIDMPPAADANTLLVDNFETIDYCNGRMASYAETISPETEAGYLTPDAEIGEGRWGRGIVPMKNPVRNLIEGYRHYGVETFCFHASQYTDESFAGMYIYEPERMRKTVQEIHRLGGKAIMYLNNSLSNYDRAWDAHQEDWLITPVLPPFIQAWIPDEKGYQACPRSEYIDYFFWRLAADLDEFDLDGGFLDGRMYSECDNALHGCGVVNFAGERVPERNVWDGRDKALRLYNIIENRNGFSSQHKSSIWDAPTCFYWDAVWEGEQFMMMNRKAAQKRTDILPIEAMRSQINGFVYGMPSYFAAYCEQPFTPIEYCTYSFVHGTTWIMTYRINEAAVLAPFWRAQNEFGATIKNFRPYWGEVPPCVETPDELIKVSAHVEPDKALAIIANFNEELPSIKGTYCFQWDKLGFEGPYRARDAFSNREIPVGPNGEIEIEVKSFRQSWIVFESAR